MTSKELDHRLYQALKAAAEPREVELSANHTISKREDPYFYTVFYHIYAFDEAFIDIYFDVSVKYHRFDEIQNSIVKPGEPLPFTDRLRAGSAGCEASLSQTVHRFRCDGTEEALPGLCDEILDYLKKFYADFFAAVEKEHGSLAAYYIANRETKPRLAGLACLDQEHFQDAIACFVQPALDGEKAVWTVPVHTDAQRRRAQANGAELCRSASGDSIRRSQRDQLRDFAAALQNGLDWTSDRAMYGLLPEERNPDARRPLAQRVKAAGIFKHKTKRRTAWTIRTGMEEEVIPHPKAFRAMIGELLAELEQEQIEWIVLCPPKPIGRKTCLQAVLCGDGRFHVEAVLSEKGANGTLKALYREPVSPDECCTLFVSFFERGVLKTAGWQERALYDLNAVIRATPDRLAAIVLEEEPDGDAADPDAEAAESAEPEAGGETPDEDEDSELQFRMLIAWDEPNGEGCVVSNRITHEGFKVGFMYREAPSPQRPDSGWRFLAGDEDDAYMDDPANFSVCSLNTVCNFDPDILPHLHAPVGSEWIRVDAQSFEQDDHAKPVYIEKQ